MADIIKFTGKPKNTKDKDKDTSFLTEREPVTVLFKIKTVDKHVHLDMSHKDMLLGIDTAEKFVKSLLNAIATIKKKEDL